MITGVFLGLIGRRPNFHPPKPPINRPQQPQFAYAATSISSNTVANSKRAKIQNYFMAMDSSSASNQKISDLKAHISNIQTKISCSIEKISQQRRLLIDGEPLPAKAYIETLKNLSVFLHPEIITKAELINLADTLLDINRKNIERIESECQGDEFLLKHALTQYWSDLNYLTEDFFKEIISEEMIKGIKARQFIFAEEISSEHLQKIKSLRQILFTSEIPEHCFEKLKILNESLSKLPFSEELNKKLEDCRLNIYFPLELLEFKNSLMKEEQIFESLKSELAQKQEELKKLEKQNPNL